MQHCSRTLPVARRSTPSSRASQAVTAPSLRPSSRRKARRRTRTTRRRSTCRSCERSCAGFAFTAVSTLKTAAPNPKRYSVNFACAARCNLQRGHSIGKLRLVEISGSLTGSRAMHERSGQGRHLGYTPYTPAARATSMKRESSTDTAARKMSRAVQRRAQRAHENDLPRSVTRGC